MQVVRFNQVYPPTLYRSQPPPALLNAPLPLFSAKKPKEQEGFGTKVWHVFLEHYFPNRLRKVTAVHDGDTITIHGDPKNVRLFGIDAPELKQTYGPEAQQHLQKMVLGKKIKLEIKDTDQYSRKVAELFLKERHYLFWTNNVNINLKMVQDGFARAYEDKRLTNDSYLTAEKEAKAARRGIWETDSSGGGSPREFRKAKQG